MTQSVLDHSAALEKYDRDGYVLFPDVLDQDLIDEASDHVAWLHKTYPDRRGEDLSHELVAKDAFWVRLVSDPRLLDLAEQFIGPDIALFASHYISKPAYTGKAVLWHQDGAYWPLEPMKVVTMWLAIDDSTVDNGCLRVVPGSHKQNIQDLRDRDDIDSVLGSEIAAEVDEADAVDLQLTRGSVDVHHPNIIHGSKANTSPNRRCGLTIRYIPTSTKILGDAGTSAIHLRGELGVNDYLPKPAYVPGVSFPFRGAV